jgi:tetratricopeptide (TPR) repeat protein
MLYDAVTKHHLFKIDELTWAFVRPRRPIDRQLAYAQSSWICQYIELTYGHAAILGMMEQYRLGHSEDEVFQAVLHRTETEFSEEFGHWCEYQVAGWGYDPATSKKYDSLREEGEDLIRRRQYQLAIPVWEEIVKLRPVDLLPHKRLAGLYKVCNEPQKAAEQLAILAAVDVQSNVYAKATARTLRDIGKYDEAVKWARRAMYTDPYDLDAHQMLADLDEKVGDGAGADRETKVMGMLESWRAAMDAAGSAGN